ncbi:PaaI family thioesterase [Hyphococcus sp.]|uniref:PaaI family thioesterase n=1 Tax=Hyphococcus sp. TaxID=2038636 RepID=UPI0035C76648
MNFQQHETSTKNTDGMPPWAEVMRSFFSETHQLFAALQMEANKVAEDEVCVFSTVPDFFSYKDDDGSAHPGAYTIILDTVFGFAVFARIQKPKAIATINLKTEYLSPIEIGAKVICSAECHAVSGNIARTRGEIFDYDGRPLASATGAFMIASGGPDFTGLGETPRS